MNEREIKIWEKIWSIQKEVKDLVKDEKNKFQNYMYFDELQVLRLLKPLLEKYRLALMISDDDSQPFQHEREGTNHYLKYLKKMELFDFDKEISVSYKFWACGANTDLAKAKGSAETYAMKYMLSKFFLIKVMDENDPENVKLAQTTNERKKLNSYEKAR